MLKHPVGWCWPEAGIGQCPRCGIKAAGRRTIGGPSRGLPIALMAGQALQVGICRQHKVNFYYAGSADPGPPMARASSKPQRPRQARLTRRCSSVWHDTALASCATAHLSVRLALRQYLRPLSAWADRRAWRNRAYPYPFRCRYPCPPPCQKDRLAGCARRIPAG